MNRAAQRRVDKFRHIGCIACHLQGHFNPGYDVHHLVDKGTRALSGGDIASIPLCPSHHRGHPGVQGPTLANNKRAFVELFGTERQLLVLVNELLETQVIA